MLLVTRGTSQEALGPSDWVDSRPKILRSDAADADETLLDAVGGLGDGLDDLGDVVEGLVSLGGAWIL